MSENQLIVTRQDSVLEVTFNRPDQRNAMTWPMYDGLYEACEEADRDPDIRVMVLRGAGDKAFVAGTDISQFLDFTSGSDGVDYEAKISRVSARLERVTVPTIAEVRGFCLGGGLVLAAVCDLRLADTTAQFGVPIARTIGNCLSANTYSLLVHHLGPARALDMLLRASMLSAQDAHAAGFVSEVVDGTALGERTASLVRRLSEHAPLSMWAAKEAVRRIRLAGLPDADDIVEKVFGSEDFHAGVRGFLAKERPRWTGR